MSEWISTNFNCDRCGAGVDVYTHCEPDMFYDGGPVRCPECGLRGCISIDPFLDEGPVAKTVMEEFEEEED